MKVRTEYYCLEISATGRFGTFEPVGTLECNVGACNNKINFYRDKLGDNFHYRVAKFMRVEK